MCVYVHIWNVCINVGTTLHMFACITFVWIVCLNKYSIKQNMQNTLDKGQVYYQFAHTD